MYSFYDLHALSCMTKILHKALCVTLLGAGLAMFFGARSQSLETEEPTAKSTEQSETETESTRRRPDNIRWTETESTRRRPREQQMNQYPLL